MQNSVQSLEKLKLAKRIKSRVIINSQNECWECTFTRNAKGYCKIGIFNFSQFPDRRMFYAHRIAAYVWCNFDLKSDLLVLHRCDNPACVNPDHLFFGTYTDNLQDCIKKGRYRQFHPCGSALGYTKLHERDIPKIRQSNETYRKLAKRYNVTPSTIGAVKKGITWTHVKS